jgi:hypothetical protein
MAYLAYLAGSVSASNAAIESWPYQYQRWLM